ncbi:PEP-CTERM sorting domain-containing protein [Verrucomicrobiaceae bacterium N1E253]|uniref:PEP-CTERM sorting domain-containing protein n=1 Tax=Oceaniferula marina TaxID=2748318 RepID=A0A851G8T7_9BACT|nr:PEP-CTERM sorting domain-containing protein [Oceaniferula marina]NWK54128.1 PEP-CTERM sorting domain-containing protein [Oceaniferula marina]
MKIKYTIAALAATTMVVNAASYTLLTKKEVLANVMLGSDVTSGNGWTINGSATITPTAGVAGSIHLTTTGTSHSTLVGTTATAPGAAVDWDSTVSPNTFTLEVSMRVNDLTDGFKFWAGTGDRIYMLDIYNDKVTTTNSGGGLKDVAMTLNDGEFHTFRLVADNTNPGAHVWVDGVHIGDEVGGVFNSGTNDSRFILGDTTSGSFGDDIDVDIAYISYDAGAFAPVPEPSSAALVGLGGLALILRRRK